ncbi:PorT family protein [Paludibacteraceae bacterium OttesenSCG-928-F17]|nr:PorT family protein [Paludibacteraceae bacterium OttesenSCG-928-F17]
MKKIYLFLAFTFCAFTLSAHTVQNDTTRSRWKNITDYTKGILRSAAAGIEYRVKAGIALGGTAPIPIPLEIQEINNFNPLVNSSLEVEFMKTISDDGGLSIGLRLESKGMETNASVKNYNMKMVSDDGGEIAGVWTGMVNTRVSLTYLTLPILAVWKPSQRWDIKLGPYMSYRLYGTFSGSAYDGYLRVGSPIGEKREFRDDKEAIYNFSEDLRRMNFGVQLGADWRAFTHLLVGLDLTWGFNSILKKDFDVITFKMYPIFLRLNFAYSF